MPTKRKSEAAQNAAKRVRSSGGSERKRKREAARARGGSPKRTRFSKGDAVEYCAARSGWIPARVLRAVLDPGGNFYTIEVECAAGGRSERHTVAGRLRPAAKSASLRSRAAAAGRGGITRAALIGEQTGCVDSGMRGWRSNARHHPLRACLVLRHGYKQWFQRVWRHPRKYPAGHVPTCQG